MASKWLAANSPSIDAGDDDLLPEDVYDIDNDPNTTVHPLDLAWRDRIANGGISLTVDQGAFEYRPPHACLPDLNNSGTVDVLDLLILLAAWGACPDPNDCPADLNGSGAVDVQDLLILLAAWGPCPEFAGDPWSGTTVPETVQDCLNMYTGTLLEKCLEMIAQMEELLGEE
ncbi:MAG TPA: hypothetical protein PK400_11860 [Phycisphaerales bacterium]|nr:hypothetical protein [Phycisphaerales bacterium]HRQ74814.1 hypothetical protein [Phycisphaerales bacterium]